MERKGRFFLWLAMLLTAALLTALPAAGTAEPDPDGCTSASGRHDWQPVHENPAACESPGTKFWECGVCGKQVTETIPATGHQWGEWQEDPSCEQETMKQRQCQVCQTWESETVPPMGHAWDGGAVTTAATCTTDGVRTYTCTRCGATRTDSIPATGHDAVAIPPVDATCTTGGKTGGYQCSVCGAVLTAQQDTAALGHAWDGGAVTAAATCTTAGVKTYTCTRCGATTTESIAATGHSAVSLPAVAATCTAGGKTEGSQCATCGAILTVQQDTAALGHAWDGGAVTAAATCTTAGVKTYTCTRCGAATTESIAATGHSAVSLPAVAATCTAGGKTEGSQCATCGAILTAQQDTAALGHAWDGGAVTAAATCTAAGVKTYTCTRCGATTTESIAATGHSAVPLPAVAATCTAGGKTGGSKCATCGAVLTAQQDTAALGHAWDGGAVTQEAGLMVPGSVTYTCTRCGQTRTEETPLQEAAGSASFDLFALIRCNPDSNADGDPLRIDTHPQDGKVGRGSQNGYELFVDVSGGLPPYTFEWYYRPIVNGSRSAEGAAASGGTSALWGCVRSAWGAASSGIHAGAAAARSASAGLYGAMEAGGAVQTMKKSSRYQAYETDDTFSLPGQRIQGADGSLYTTFEGGREYYCVVRDKAGSTAVSNSAAVLWGLEFFVQPGNHKLEAEGGKAFLYAQARGGSGEYYYEWYRGDGARIPESEEVHENYCAVTEPGEYYCVAYDLPDSVRSETAVVYSAGLLTVDVEDAEVPPDREYLLSAIIEGGVPPYSCEWTYRDQDGEESEVPGYETEEEISKLPVNGSNPGKYTVTVTDSMGETASGNGYVFNPIAPEEPEEIIPAAAEGPLNIADYTKLAEIYVLGEEATLNVRVEGGQPPYTYIWQKTSVDNDFEKAGEYLDPDLVRGTDDTGLLSLPVQEPYTLWKCTVKDSAGDSDAVDYLEVKYSGTDLVIVQQPEDVQLEYSGNDPYVASFQCKAVTHSGHTLRYTWQKKRGNCWEDVSAYTSKSGKTGIKLEERMTETTRSVLGNGKYRCKVRDLDSGKEVTSREASVRVPDLSAKAYQVGDSNTIKVEVFGGSPGYTITCQRMRMPHHANHVYNYNGVIQNYSLEGDMSCQVEGFHLYVYTIEGCARFNKKWDSDNLFGKKHNGYTYIPWRYEFTITDSEGASVTADTGELRWGW